MFSTRHGAGRNHFSLRCTISFEDLVHGKMRPSRLLAGTAYTEVLVQSLKEVAGMLSERDRRQGRGHKLAEIVSLLSRHCLAEWPSLQKELRGEMVL